MTQATSHSTPHGVRDAVISCIDYRFRPIISKWIAEHLGDQADLIAVAGAAKTLNDAASCDYIESLIKIARDLHGVTTIHLLNHMDCGAYGGSTQHASERAEQHFHAEQCTLAAEKLSHCFPGVTVRRYIVDFTGVHPVEAEEKALA